MEKYYFFYYFIHDHMVACAKGMERDGHAVGGSLRPVNSSNKFEITRDEWQNMSLNDLKGKYEYSEGGNNG